MVRLRIGDVIAPVGLVQTESCRLLRIIVTQRDEEGKASSPVGPVMTAEWLPSLYVRRTRLPLVSVMPSR